MQLNMKKPVWVCGWALGGVGSGGRGLKGVMWQVVRQEGGCLLRGVFMLRNVPCCAPAHWS